jgi:hypothetical protein
MNGHVVTIHETGLDRAFFVTCICLDPTTGGTWRRACFFGLAEAEDVADRHLSEMGVTKVVIL